MSKASLLEYFCKGVYNVTRQYMENATRGDFLELPIDESWKLLQKLAKQSRLWSSPWEVTNGKKGGIYEISKEASEDLASEMALFIKKFHEKSQLENIDNQKINYFTKWFLNISKRCFFMIFFNKRVLF